MTGLCSRINFHADCVLFMHNRVKYATLIKDVPVAQSDRAAASEAEGRGFESLPERHMIFRSTSVDLFDAKTCLA